MYIASHIQVHNKYAIKVPIVFTSQKANNFKLVCIYVCKNACTHADAFLLYICVCMYVIYG